MGGGESDAWHEGEACERCVGRWSRAVALEFLDWLGARAWAARGRVAA